MDIKKDLSTSTKSTIEALTKSSIDFAPTGTLLSNETTGWIGSNHISACEFIYYILRYMDQCIARKNHNDLNRKDYNSKMHKNYSLLRNLDAPNTTKGKREAALKHW